MYYIYNETDEIFVRQKKTENVKIPLTYAYVNNVHLSPIWF